MTYLYSSPKMKIWSSPPGLRNPSRQKIIRKRVSSCPPKNAHPITLLACRFASPKNAKSVTGLPTLKIVSLFLRNGMAKLTIASKDDIPVQLAKNENLFVAARSEKSKAQKNHSKESFIRPAKNARPITLLACQFVSPKMQSRRRVSLLSKLCHRRHVREIQVGKKIIPKRLIHIARLKCVSHPIACLSIHVTKNAKSAPGLPNLKIVPSPPGLRNPSRQKNHSKEIPVARRKCVSHPIACLPIRVAKNTKSRRRVSLISKLCHRHQVREIQVGKKIIPKSFTSPAKNAHPITLLACRFASPKMQSRRRVSLLSKSWVFFFETAWQNWQ